MRKTVIAFSPRTVSRVAMISAVALMAAGCSSDAVRFGGGSPFSNPFASNQTQQEPSYTGTVASAPSASVSTSPLPPVGGGAPSPQPQQYGYSVPAQAQQQASYQTDRAPSQGYQKPAGAVRMGADRDWSLDGGTPVTVGASDSLNTISTRYGVPASAIVATNGLSPTQPLSPGQKIVIPVFKRAGGAAVASQSQPAPVTTASVAPKAAGGAHTVAVGETLFSLARTYGVSHRDIATANGISPDTGLRVGQRIVIPGMTAPAGAAVAAKPASQAATQSVSSAYAPAAAKPIVSQQTAVAPQTQTPVEQPRQQPAVATVQPAVARPEDATAAASSAAQAGQMDFRWPVRGRVISGFGSKPNGKSNDGINLAVPEGTPIRAAESGTVAYAGSELASFGNMVLIRHADGWVTAYAHASEVSVKKGDIVRRGQVIARAGRSGDVSAPQLHFEVRRGSNPVDPLDHLPRS